MKTLTVRLPEALVAQIEAESRRRNLSKSDVVRERLTGAQGSRPEQLGRWAAARFERADEKIPEVDRIWRQARSLMPVFSWRS
jgi:Arc/MetJ-type ribon-helix-helix transcriptional regulator